MMEQVGISMMAGIIESVVALAGEYAAEGLTPAHLHESPVS